MLAVYPRRSAKYTLAFLERVVEEMPFAIQRLPTDRGLESFAEKVQRQLMDWAIKFRPTKPRSPHLNGKVERTQRADLEEFWTTVDPRAPDLQERLAEWQHFWNWHRPHSALNGKTPIDRVCELSPKTPLRDEVEAAYDPTKERIRTANYAVDATLAALK
ncbi:transposase InsO family protein [Azospirillum canadense]|nr:transposase InsO family protein [Azospirillum canadense]